ncbi:uncharacterized protein EV422DRAFT_277891 [Fimicolochytrium jonesii]|uniref:uncharacterized protein n=1 Tax=Fimicolochytrium jonesii TaxID=1396493 RepID=UPI0022FDE5D7|nr:uncharacterized protein EV422DRAFT_277891 [Fimicolochytrium jonesii]KAI8816763.1 hypothetical protein EV422DRAFT_277891 [Fimicolochytrium jonesii]
MRCLVHEQRMLTSQLLLVGALNHRYFILFSGTLPLGAWMFVHIVFACRSSNLTSTFKAHQTHMKYQSDLDSLFDTPRPPTYYECSLPIDGLCGYFAYDGFAFLVAIWTLLNSIWCFFLFLTQLWQISQAYTTNEGANWWRLSYMVVPGDMAQPSWRRRMRNPFSRGIFRNCGEFWGGSEVQLNSKRTKTRSRW